MIRFTHPVLKELGFAPDRVFLSLENRMKCGIGKCGRCNIGEKYVCRDGPVFSDEQLLSLSADYQPDRQGHPHPLLHSRGGFGDCWGSRHPIHQGNRHPCHYLSRHPNRQRPL